MEDSKPDKNSQNAKIKISMNNRGTKLSREADLSSDVPAIFKKRNVLPARARIYRPVLKCQARR